MAFNTPLTTEQYALLRSGHYEGQVNVSFFSGRVVLAGQTTGDLSIVKSWYAFGYSASSGDYTECTDGMTLIMGSVNDLEYCARYERAFHGRLRGDPTSNVITCNISSVPFPTGTYFWVIDEYEILNRLSRPTGVLPNIIQKVDTTLDYQGMQPRITGLLTGYAGDADPVTGLYRLSLSVTGHVEQVGTTITGYLWSFRSGIATVVSGSLSSDTVTVDLDPSACAVWGETWGTLTVTQSDGVTLVRRFGIKITDEDHPPDVSFENIQVRATWSQNYTASLPAFAGVDDILPGTPAILWRSNETYGDTPGALTDNNIIFIGWMVNEQGTIKGDKDYSTLTDATFQLAGVGARLNYLIEQLLMIVNDSTPTIWDEIWFANPRRTVWHVLTRHSTAGTLCDVDFDEDNLTEFYQLPAIPLKGTNILAVCNNVMKQVDGALEFAPDGRIFACRDGQFLTDSAYDNLPIIANWTAGDDTTISDGFVVAYNVSYDNSVGVVDMIGVSYNSASASVQAYKSRAPGMAMGESQGTTSVTDQILTSGHDPNAAQAENNERCGRWYGVTNLTEEITFDHGDGYNFLIPSKGELYTLTIDQNIGGPQGVHRIKFDTNTKWFVKSVEYRPGNNGTNKTRVVYKRITRNTPDGQTITSTPDVGVTIPPLPPISFPSLPALPPFPEPGLPVLPPAYKPPTGKITHLDGNTVIISNDTDAWITKSYIALASPIWFGITPDDLGSFAIQDVLFDPFGPINNTCGVYLLANDGVNSAIWYTENALASPPTWTKGDEFAGLYTEIRAASTQGSVLVWNGSGTLTTHVEDFTINDQGWTVYPSYGGTYVAATGWKDTDRSPGAGDTAYRRIVFIQKALTGTVVSVDVLYNLTKGIDEVDEAAGSIYANSVTIRAREVLWSSLVDGSNLHLTYHGSFNMTDLEVSIWSDMSLSSASGFTGSVLIKKITYVTASGNGGVRLSTDYGATVGSAVTVGSTAGSGGFDLIRTGGVSYAAVENLIRKASTLGGSYSDFATLSVNPTSVVIPYFQVGSNTVRQTSSANPQVIVGLAAVSGGTCLYYFDGSGTPTAITTPASGAVISSPNKITILRGTKIAVIANVDGFEKLYVAENLAADGSATWTFIKNVSEKATLRCRRNDGLTGSHRGQLFLFDDPCGYSSKWASASEWPRTSPDSDIAAGDIYN